MPSKDRERFASSFRTLPIWRALGSRNYRLFFGGQGVSLIGTWVQRVALYWLAYRLTDSAVVLGAVGFAGNIPAFVLSPVAGVLADRWDLRRSLIVAQVLALVQALVLAWLTVTEAVAVWHILALSAVLGVINAFDMPARQAFVVQMVDRAEDLSNAIALNSFLVNGARLLGPVAAGVLVAVVGEGTCFVLNAVSYVPVIAALVAMRMAPRARRERSESLTRDLREGFAYAFGFAPIRALLVLLGLSSLMGMPYATLMPIFAKDILRGGPYTLGLLLASSGLGALIGATYLASRSSVVGLERITIAGTALFGLSLAAFACSSVLWLSLAMMLLSGLGMMLQMAATITLLQTLVDDDKRGRVMSLYTMAFLGMSPFGSLLAGYLAGWIGASWTLLLGGLCCVLGALVFAIRWPALRRLVQPVYVRKGILSEASPEI